MPWLNGSLALVLLLVATPPLFPQTTTGTITGRVVDSQDLPIPGATVTVSGPGVPGALAALTSESGEYILPLLPPGTYSVSVELSGFEPQERVLTVAATQVVPLNVRLGPAALEEAVLVVGQPADVLTRTAVVGTSFKQDVIAALPTNRDLSASLLMAPSVHPTGPSGNFTIAGAMSFESLFMVNGVTVNENVRGQPFALYVEDAIQEIVVATDGVSAEYGRFSGGIVNVITKSGTNRFSGSFRDTLYNDNWRARVVGNGNFQTPGETGAPCNLVAGIGGTQVPDPHCFSGDTKVAKVTPTYEYVLGGPVLRDRLWFFTAGRFQNLETARNTANPVNLPYVFQDKRERYEIKLTGSVNIRHRLEGSYQKEAATQSNNAVGNVLDFASLYTRRTPLDSLQFGYSGVLSSQLFFEARVSTRAFSFIGNGAPTTDVIGGTNLLDRARGNLRYWSPTFCGVCGPEERDNDNEYVKLTYFKPTKNSGSHTIVLGYDSFNDRRLANNHQSGSDYRIFGTTSIARPGDTDCALAPGCVFPQFLPGSTILQYSPILAESRGTNFRRHALFVNDTLRLHSRWTFNLGVRWDKNHGVDSAGNLVARDSRLTPRLGVVWDPAGNGIWTLTASYGVYLAALANTIADVSSPAGNPTFAQWAYRGPAINSDAQAPTTTLIGPAEAIQRVLDWCARDSRGFCTAALPIASQVPGVSVKISDDLASPSVSAHAVGVSRQLGRAVLRADYSYRRYSDFYSQRIDLSTGTVIDDFGNVSDVAVVENNSDLSRRYSGLTASATYRVGRGVQVGGNYTLSRLWGNFEGENVGSGPLASDVFQYPEYRQLSWYAPEGNLAQDQRHRSALWMTFEVPRVNGLVLSLLQTLASGVPYGAGGGGSIQIGFAPSASVDATPYVPNPGYATPPTQQSYYYTKRDAFRTESVRRTDVAVNYSRPFEVRSRKFEPFVQAQMINIFNHQDLCACGGTVLENGGGIALNRIGSGVLTPVNTRSLPQFNPLTETPVQGVHWNYAPNFGTPLNRFAFSTPRMFRLSFGLRF